MVLSVAVAVIGVLVAFLLIRGQGHSVEEEARVSAEAAQAI
jgi:hypothetical protein